MGCPGVFYGEVPSSVDSAGRVIVPAAMRKAAREAEGKAQAEFVMRFGEDGCVVVYTPSRWAAVEAAVNRAPQGSERARRRRRLLFALAGEGRCDKQGRLRIHPAALLEAAGITRDVVIVGVSDQIEIWDRARWRAQKEGMMRESLHDAEEYPEG